METKKLLYKYIMLSKDNYFDWIYYVNEYDDLKKN